MLLATLAIAVYCALKYERDFDKAIRVAVNHNGNSDSTGAVCGNILGAYLGYDAIPQKYKEHLELHDVIIEIADDLFNDCQISEYDLNRDEVWESDCISSYALISSYSCLENEVKNIVSKVGDFYIDLNDGEDHGGAFNLTAEQMISVALSIGCSAFIYGDDEYLSPMRFFYSFSIPHRRCDPSASV